MSEGRRYHIEHAVGRGSFGTVYRAHMTSDEGFSKVVAVKILNADADAVVDLARRLRDEARLLALIRHRAVLKVDGLVLLDGRWAVVMEFVDGTTLHELIVKGPVPPGPALEVTAEIASALHHAWHATAPDGAELHLVHRDIKPANIQLAQTGEIKLLDFGIARADFQTREAETTAVLMGSFAYMAPERLDGIDGPAGDVYALGATLYEMLVGRRLGRTSANRDRHAELVDEAVRVLREAVRGQHHGENLVGLVRRALHYDADARPTARELEEACRELRQWVGGPFLARWAEELVPPICAATRRELGPDELSGMTLLERSGLTDRLAESGRFPAERRASPARWLGLGAGAALLLGAPIGGAVLALGAWAVWLALDPRPPAAEYTLPELPEEPLDQPEEPTEQPDVAAGQASHVPEPPPPLPRAPAVPEAGHVTVDPPDVLVRLRPVAGGTSVTPGDVPPGRYDVLATFPGKAEVVAGQVEVGAGHRVALTCQAAFRRCAP